MYKQRVSTLAKRLKEALRIRGVKQVEICQQLSIPKGAMCHYVKGDYEPRQDRIDQIAKALRVSEAWLMGYDVPIENDFTERKVRKKAIPFLGNVACGEPIWAEEERGAYVEADTDLDADFCLEAKGDSMVNARIFDGDLLFVRRQPTVEDGEIAVVLIENEATVKRVYYDKENNTITLMPENPVYKPMRYVGAELDQIVILGKVVAGQYKI